MKARIQKWRKSFAKNLAYKADLQNGQIRIKPVYHYELADLLAVITDENKHREIDTGSAQGSEVF
jgi:antitoxin component of MazEF toxin-antitoxin module